MEAVFYVSEYLAAGKSDSEAVRLCLAAAAEVVTPRTIVFDKKDYALEEAVLLPSHTTVVIDDCTVALADGVADNLFRGKNVIPDPKAPYGLPLAVHPTEEIKILGRGNAAISGPSVNKIAFHSVLNEKQSMVGDFWGWRTHLVSLTYCTGFEIGGLSVSKTRGWAFCFDLCRNGYVHDVHFMTDVKNGDGIDFRSGCHDCLVERISGITSDDSIACTAIWNEDDRFPNGNYLYPHEPGYCIRNRSAEQRDISHITIRDIRTAGRHHAVICLAACGCKVHDIVIEGVHEPMHEDWREALVKLYTGYGKGYSAGDIHDIHVKDLRASYAKYALYCNAEVKNVTVEQAFHPDPARAVAPDHPEGVKVI